VTSLHRFTILTSISRCPHFLTSVTLSASATNLCTINHERMDLATLAEQDMADASVSATTFPPKGPSVMDEEHVTWQSSQRREVLSRFMVSTRKRFQRDRSPEGILPINIILGDMLIFALGWQLDPFSTEPSTQSDSGNLSAFSRRPLSRTHTSEENIGPRSDPAKSSASDCTSPIPFFDKANPARFLALLKGVSARVDENAGLRNYDISGPSGPTDGIAKVKRKRPQMTSIGRSLAAKRIRPNTSGGENAGEFRPALAMSQDLRGCQSLPNVTSEDIFSQETKESQDEPVLFNGPSRISPSFFQKFKDPPLPPPSEKQKTNFDDTKSSQTKLHPLLEKAPSEPSSMTPPRGPHSRVARIRGSSNSTPDTGLYSGKTLSPELSASSRTSTPGAAEKFSSSRLPVLGMRRNRTLPSQRYGFQTGTTLVLPTKQRGFKPPLLPNQSQQPNSKRPS